MCLLEQLDSEKPFSTGTGQNCAKIILHQGSILHELQLCTEGHF